MKKETAQRAIRQFLLFGSTRFRRMLPLICPQMAAHFGHGAIKQIENKLEEDLALVKLQGKGALAEDQSDHLHSRGA